MNGLIVGSVLGVMASLIPLTGHAQQMHVVPFTSPGASTTGQRGPYTAEVTRSLDLNGVTLQQALDTIAARFGVRIAFAKSDVESAKRITVHDTALTLPAALNKVLHGTGLRFRTLPTGQLVITRAPVASTDSVGRTVEGRVTESSNGTPVAGATVQVVGTSIFRTTNQAGVFFLPNVPDGSHVIRVSRLGYRRSETPVTVRAGVGALVITLTPVSIRLNEVVTTATGQQKRLELGNSIASINADSVVKNAPVRNLSDLIAARAPGAQVMQTSGTVGAGSRIRIRGIGRLSGSSDPIVIVDGVRLQTDFSSGLVAFNQASPSSTSTQTSATSRFDDIDPNSIETIDILKGPSAATLYGSDAANGVIVITTKRGTPGSARWYFFGEHGTIKMPSSFSESYRGWGTSPVYGPGTACTLAYLSTGDCTTIDSVTSWNPLNHKDTSPFTTGSNTTYGAQVSGGSASILYFFGGSLVDDIGVLKMPDADIALLETERHGAEIPDWQMHPNQLSKQSANTRITANFGTIGDLSLSVSGTHQQQLNMNDNQVIQNAMLSPGYRDSTYYGWPLNVGSRPAELFTPKGSNTVMRGYTSVAGNVHPMSWLAARGTIGVDYTNQRDEYMVRTGDIPNLTATQDGVRNRADLVNTVYSADFSTTLTTPLTSALSLRSTVGGQYTRSSSSSISAQGTGISKGAATFNGAKTLTVTESFGANATAGWFLEETGVINERMYLTAAFRQDAGSAFGDHVKAPLYPKLSLSWLLSQEPFFPHIRGVSNLRLRSAYGHAGVQPAPTSVYRTFSSGAGWTGGAVTATADLSAVGNANLLPERSKELEAGADVSILDDRITIEGTYYRKRTDNALVGRSVPASLGGGGRQENIGAVLNTGTEWTITAQAVATRAFSWDLVLGTSANRNVLLTLGPNVTPSSAAAVLAGEVYRPGYPLSGNWERPILGYNDVNGDGILDASEVYTGDSLVFVGEPTPARSTSLTTTFGFLNNSVHLSGMFDYRGGLGTRDLATANRCNSGLCRAQVDPNTSLGNQAQVIAYTTQGAGGFGTAYGFTRSLSYTRLRQVTLSYLMPAGIASRVHARTATILLMGTNLGLWSKYSGPDPEVNTRPIRNYILDSGGLPMTREWTVRINLGL